MPAAFLFLSAAFPFLYSSSDKGYIIVSSPVASVSSTGRFGLLDVVPRLLMITGCANWLATWRCCGGVSGDVLDSFPCLGTVMCQNSRCNDFFSSIILSTSLAPASIAVSPN